MKVAVYFGTGYEEIEALGAVDVLRRAGIEVILVGVDAKTVVSSHKISINMDAVITEINHDEVDMMVLPGGVPGVNNLANNALLLEQLKKFKNEGKWIAAICAAPGVVLGEAGLLEGEKATCYPGYEEKMRGCEAVDEKVVVSHKVITAKGAGVSLEFAYKILEVLKGKETADKIRHRMIAN